MLKKILVSLAVVVILFLSVGFFLPSSYEVKRSVVIESGSAGIFPFINNLKKWQEWTPWTREKYPQMVMSYSGPDYGIGAESSWVDEENGNGKLIIKQSNPESGIDYELTFDDYAPSQGRITMVKEGDFTRVSMELKGDLGNNPIGRYFGLFMDSAMGAQFEEGLENLKKLVEKK
jgi:hypothetical protein